MTPKNGRQTRSATHAHTTPANAGAASSVPFTGTTQKRAGVNAATHHLQRMTH
jgi:hypothetical protein